MVMFGLMRKSHYDCGIIRGHRFGFEKTWTNNGKTCGVAKRWWRFRCRVCGYTYTREQDEVDVRLGRPLVLSPEESSLVKAELGRLHD